MMKDNTKPDSCDVYANSNKPAAKPIVVETPKKAERAKKVKEK